MTILRRGSIDTLSAPGSHFRLHRFMASVALCTMARCRYLLIVYSKTSRGTMHARAGLSSVGKH